MILIIIIVVIVVIIIIIITPGLIRIFIITIIKEPVLLKIIHAAVILLIIFRNSLGCFYLTHVISCPRLLNIGIITGVRIIYIVIQRILRLIRNRIIKALIFGIHAIIIIHIIGNNFRVLTNSRYTVRIGILSVYLGIQNKIFIPNS